MVDIEVIAEAHLRHISVAIGVQPGTKQGIRRIKVPGLQSDIYK
jgi:hypothetical protein